MMKKKISKIGSILTTLLIIVEAIVIVAVVVCRVSGQIPSVFGYQFYVIVSPSMEPQIHVGDMIVSKKYAGEDLQVGDVVTYLGLSGEMAGKMITHEIVEISDDTIVTKGCANSTADPPVSREDIQAVMKGKAVILSAVYDVMSSTIGFIALVMLPLATMTVWEIVTLIIQIKKEGGIEGEEDRKEGIGE